MDLVKTLRYVFGAENVWTDRDLDGLEALPMADQPRLNEDVTSGWEGRSSDFPYRSYMVFEVGDIARSKAFIAWALEEKVRFKEVRGQWFGAGATAFVMEDTSQLRMKIAYWVRGQEAILALSPAWRYDPSVGTNRLFGNRVAHIDLLASDGYQVTERTYAGLFQAVGRDQALREDSWTYDPASEAYYIIVNPPVPAIPSPLQASAPAICHAPEPDDLGIWADDGGRHIDQE